MANFIRNEILLITKIYLIMRTLVTIFIGVLLLTTTDLAAQQHSTYDLAYNHLKSVNAEWTNLREVAREEKVKFESETGRIQFHLESAIDYLSEKQPKRFVKKALEQRRKLIENLSDYASAQKFPINTRHSVRRPYFIDDFGTYCAVGYLISISGHDDLARKINAEHRYDYIKDIKTDGLGTWAINHGFTKEELALIQPGYAPNATLTAVGTGTNGPIEKMINDPYDGRILLAGSFTELDGMDCENIGYYTGTQLGCIGNGLEGTVNDIRVTPDGPVAVGALVSDGNTYPMAIFSNNTWEFSAIPNRTGATGHAVMTQNGDVKFEVAISHPSVPGKHEVWVRMTNGSWIKRATVEGEIEVISSTTYGMCYAGKFSSSTVHNSSGDSAFSANNVLFRGHGGSGWFVTDDKVSERVLAVEQVGSSVYIGGECSDDQNKSDICMSRFLNQTLQPVVLKESFWDSGMSYVNSIHLYNNEELLLGGKFDIQPMLGTYGQNLARFSLVFNYTEALTLLNNSVSGVELVNNKVIIGGDFTQGGSSQTSLPHLAEVGNIIPGVEEENQFTHINIYPNPASDHINVATDDRLKVSGIQIYDVMGREVFRTRTSPNSAIQELNISALDPGMYVMSIQSETEGQLRRSFEVR